MNKQSKKYKYEYYKKDKLSGKVIQYDEKFTEQKSFKDVFDLVLANHFYKDELAENEYYYQVYVTHYKNTFDNFNMPSQICSKTYINRQEI